MVEAIKNQREMLRTIQESVRPLSPSSSSSSSSSSARTSSSGDNSITILSRSDFLTPRPPGACKPLAVLTAHTGSVSCLALCGEFLLSASQGKDIIVWQQPDLKMFAKFGQGDGSVKALVTVGNKVFTAHQDSRIRVWRVSRSSENAFKLIETLPTTKDYLGKFMKQRNYVQTRRNHKRLWIEHADSISCLVVQNGFIYSGSWDKTLKVWRLSDFKCLESIKAHDDAIHGLVACKSTGTVFSASADGRIKAWGKREQKKKKEKGEEEEDSHVLKAILKGHDDVSMNSVVVSEDGKWVYGGGSDGFIIGWEKKQNQKIDNKNISQCDEEWKLGFEIEAHKVAVLCLCLVGEFLCSGSADKSIRIWKKMEGGDGSGKLCKFGVINGHEGPVKCLAASPAANIGNGFLLYSGGLDKSIRVWWVPKQNGENREEDDLISLGVQRLTSNVQLSENQRPTVVMNKTCAKN